MSIPPDRPGESAVCAICKKPNPDFQHKCEAEYHATCLEEYRKFIGSSEYVCPHCLETITPEKKEEEFDIVSVSSGPGELLAQQYLDLTDEYYLELVRNDMHYVKVFVNNMDPESGIWHMYPITVNYSNYPERPRMTFPEDVLTDALDLSETVDMLRNWNPEKPKTILEIIKTVESAITDKNRLYEEIDQVVKEEDGIRNDGISVEFRFNTYGSQEVSFILDLSGYPGPPGVLIEGIQMERGFPKIKEWKRRTSTLAGVVREVKRTLDRHYRRELEIAQLEHYFEILDNKDLHVMMSRTEPASKLVFQVEFPEKHPVEPPAIRLEEYDGVETEDLDKVFKVFDNFKKRWKHHTYVVDILLDVMNQVFGEVRLHCPYCGHVDCPECGAAETEDTGEACPHCGHMFHQHCFAKVRVCPFCTAPLTDEEAVETPLEVEAVEPEPVEAEEVFEVMPDD